LFSAPHIDVAESLDALGTVHYETGDMPGAQRDFEEALQILRQAAPEGHPLTLSVMNDLSAVLLECGRFQESETLTRSLLAARRRFIGGETLPVAITRGNLGAVLAHLGKHAEAEQSFRSAYALFVMLLGPEHWQVANAARNLARIRLLRGDNTGAARWFRNAIQVQRRVTDSGEGDWFMRGQAAVATARTGRTAEAMKELRLVLDRLVASGVHASRTAEARIALGFLLLDAGKNGEAAALFRQSLDSRRADTPADHPSIAEAECALGAALATQGNPEGRLLVERSWPRYRAWGLADPVYRARIQRSLSSR